VGVEVADVTGLEPAVDESIGSFVGTFPIALENGGATDEDFAVVRDLNFDISQWFADSAEFVRVWRVDGDDRRCFRQTIALVDANADPRKPLREFAAQRRPA